MGTRHHRGVFRRSNGSVRLIATTLIGMLFGYFFGVSFPYLHLKKVNLSSSLISSLDVTFNDNHHSSSRDSTTTPKIYVPMNPHGAETLPPGIVVSESDFYLRRLWGEPSEVTSPFSVRKYFAPFISSMKKTDFEKKPKYLVTFTVGLAQKDNIDAAVKKFSDDFQILLFHYDGRASDWDQFEWSKNAVHVSAKKQTKWWYAKRFLHPDIIAAYDYIFIWDEDLGVEHFNADKYIQLVKKHGLEISQPGLEPNESLTWEMTKRRDDREVHKDTLEQPGWCNDPHLPPCAAFVEIMAPVFSREAWRCVWYMIQSDLVHGWGIDFALRRCVEFPFWRTTLTLLMRHRRVYVVFAMPHKFTSNSLLIGDFHSFPLQPAHEKIGVVDSQWVVHQIIPSLGSQGTYENGKTPWEGVRERCRSEWAQFQIRLAKADKLYLAEHRRG